MIDQAESLRKMIVDNKGEQKIKANRIIKIFTVVSGKGGVGKTNVSVNLAISLAQEGKSVLLLDADIGMTNADIIMGINYKYDLFDYLEGRAELNEIICDGYEGVKVISGGSGLFKLDSLSENSQRTFISELMQLGGFDVMIIDNGAGISRETLSFITFSHEVILVTTPEPTAVADAYRVLKTIAFFGLKSSVKLIVNMVDSVDEGTEIYRRLHKIAKEFLDINIENIGAIFCDSRVQKAIMQQNPVVLAYPNSLSSKNLKNITAKILDGSMYVRNVSTLEQFGNRLMKIFGT